MNEMVSLTTTEMFEIIEVFETCVCTS